VGEPHPYLSPLIAQSPTPRFPSHLKVGQIGNCFFKLSYRLDTNKDKQIKQLVYAFRQGQQANFSNSQNQPPLIDPSVIRAAGQIYYTYCEVHPEIVGQASGVAINRVSLRGKVIFTSQPVLLPQECFVPLNQIESYMY
jgi:hypothetical protein